MKEEDRLGATLSRPYHVPRRRMPVRLQLADGQVVAGAAYVAVPGAGAQERLLDRLNDFREHFLPIAAEGRHLLVRKTAIVSAWTADLSEVRAERQASRAREIAVEVITSRGPAIEGYLGSERTPSNDRALDILNRLGAPFVALLGQEAITFVNTAHVVAVLELHAPP